MKPLEMLEHVADVQVQALQRHHLLSLPPSSPPLQSYPKHSPQAAPDSAALCQQEAVPLKAQSEEKSAEAEAAGTAGVQGGSVSQTEGQFDGAAPADSAGDDSVSGGDGGDCSVEAVSSGGNKSHSSGAGSGGGRSAHGGSGDGDSGGSHSSGSDGGSGVSHAGSGAAVQSALRLPAVPADGAPPATLPVPESGHGKETDKASGGGAEQGGMVGGSSGGTLGAIQYIPTFSLNPNMMPFDQWLLQYKDIKAGEAAAAKGRRVSGSANCNAKQEAHAFLADLGCECALHPDAADAAASVP